ncbi:MAG: cytochrome oxidase assembly [candidate division NC10 bacterium]|nr:cytochrome oxidase assembly [candidate division NC10 bacterium]
MSSDGAKSETIVTRAHYVLLLIASVVTYLLILMGGVVCMTGSGLGCPDWPMCYGQIIPPVHMGAIIETTHRFLAASTSPLILAAAVVGWRKHRSIWWLSRPPAIAVALVLAVVVFGAFAVLTGLPPIIAAIDVGSALMVLALVLTTCAVARARRDDPALPDRLAFRAPFAALTLAALTAVFLVLVSGPLVADIGSVARCVGWPLYGAVAGAAEVGGILPPVRRALGAAAAVLVVAVVIQAWRLHRGDAAILRGAKALAIALVVEATIGTLMLAHGFTFLYGVVYSAAAAGVWALLVVLAVLAATRQDASQPRWLASGG